MALDSAWGGCPSPGIILLPLSPMAQGSAHSAMEVPPPPPHCGPPGQGGSILVPHMGLGPCCPPHPVPVPGGAMGLQGRGEGTVGRGL